MPEGILDFFELVWAKSHLCATILAKPSPFIDTAKRHIEGDVTIEEEKGLIDTYYKSRQGRLSVE